MINNPAANSLLALSHSKLDVQTPQRQPNPTANTLYIDSYGCHDDGLLEQWIETTSEVVSILIG